MSEKINPTSNQLYINQGHRGAAAILKVGGQLSGDVTLKEK